MASTATRSNTLEWLAIAGAVVAAVALFLPWYATDTANMSSQIDGVRGELSGWRVHEAMRYAVLACALIPLAMIAYGLTQREVARGSAEAAMVVAVNGLGIVAYFGWLYRPGDPSGTIALRYGWWISLIAFALLVVAAVRSSALPRR